MLRRGCHGENYGNYFVMVKRIINGLEIEIDEKCANVVYFPKEFVQSIEGFEGDIEVLKENIYKWNRNAEYMPLSILWELTNNCNFNCPFCYINTEKTKRFPYIKSCDWKNIIDVLVKKGMLFCCLSGGECLLHPEFLSIYKYLKQSGVLVTIFTNGSLINSEIIELFREYSPYKVEISIYGMSEKVFRRTTNCSENRNAKKILDVVEQLKENGINVKCKSPITNLNIEDVLEIQEWCRERDIDYYVSEELLPSNEGVSRDNFAVSIDELKKIRNTKKQKENIQELTQFGFKNAWECSGGKYTGVLGCDMNFYPCLSAVGIKRYTYSINDGMIKALEMHKERVKIEREKKLEFCKGCELHSICKKCILTSYKESKVEIQMYCDNISV